MGQRLPREEVTVPSTRNQGPRRVLRRSQSVRQLEGAGFEVTRPFPRHGMLQYDPFLLLDEMGPVQHQPGEAQGAPDHPHRGFETVTYVLSGEMEHRDSQGNHGRIGPGAVQWMTAGDGVVHSEMPSRAFQEKGGLMHGFQLWVNLPQADKRMRPRYQERAAAQIPTAQSADGKVSVRVIAGESLGVQAAIATRTPIVYLHVTLQPGGRLEQPLPEGFNAFAYVISGEGLFGPEEVRAGKSAAVYFERDGTTALLAAPAEGPAVDLLLLAGKPLEEPMVRYGPFVMNRPEEIEEAILDFQAGRFGQIAPELA